MGQGFCFFLLRVKKQGIRFFKKQIINVKYVFYHFSYPSGYIQIYDKNAMYHRRKIIKERIGINKEMELEQWITEYLAS